MFRMKIPEKYVTKGVNDVFSTLYTCTMYISNCIPPKECIDFEINSNVYLIYTYGKTNEIKKVVANEEVFLRIKHFVIHSQDAFQI